ncbi:zinc finger protein 32-like [Octopus sinensis]|uniref:Zinc finger protein 32-like n=1 Tax=Octopus sinensis TaxID=2607531 RepID=A0A7E6F001_9MOLL|nr:zinc finger protein 32-like [Octopus sinensis]
MENELCENQIEKKRMDFSDGMLKEEEKTLYDCDICKKSFSQRGHLTAHKHIHTGEKPHHCDFCGKSFSRNGDLNKHRRIHTGEKPYHCDICGKSFSVTSHLITHKYNHTGEKPYNCDICDKSFSQRHILNRHKYIHTGEKTYQCDICCKSFSLSVQQDYLGLFLSVLVVNDVSQSVCSPFSALYLDDAAKSVVRDLQQVIPYLKLIGLEINPSQSEVINLLRALMKDDFQDGFQKWQECWDWCIVAQDDCFEADDVKAQLECKIILFTKVKQRHFASRKCHEEMFDSKSAKEKAGVTSVL